MRNGEQVAAFERELADYCGAKYCVSAANGTVTLQAALVALGVTPGDRVATTPLTMAATSIAILNVGAVPVYCDVEPDTWIMGAAGTDNLRVLPVSLYGLHATCRGTPFDVDDAAQTLRKHGNSYFTSLSFQASKILSTGEGGALLTDDEGLAERARSYLSLGYRMSATQARIDSHALKSPTFDRHHLANSINGRMNDITAAEGRRKLTAADKLLEDRRTCADMYAVALAGCAWLKPQLVPLGWTHDYWTYAVACDTPARALWLQAAMARLGAEVPYGAWRLTYHERPFREIGNAITEWTSFTKGGDWVPTGICPVAESLQPRLLQFQCNNLQSAETNARALRKAIEEAT